MFFFQVKRGAKFFQDKFSDNYYIKIYENLLEININITKNV